MAACDEALAALCQAWRLRDRLAAHKVAGVERALRRLGRDPADCERLPPPKSPTA